MIIQNKFVIHLNNNSKIVFVKVHYVWINSDFTTLVFRYGRQSVWGILFHMPIAETHVNTGTNQHAANAK